MAEHPCRVDVVTDGDGVSLALRPGDRGRRDISSGQAGLLTTVTLVVSALGGALAGIMADRIGRVRTLMITVGTYALFTLLCGFAPNFPALISTEVEVRIQDATTHELLWQGRAELVSREADKRWQPDAVAGRLTAALFRNFPQPITR